MLIYDHSFKFFVQDNKKQLEKFVLVFYIQIKSFELQSELSLP